VSVAAVADALLSDLAPLDPLAAEALGREPDSIMPRLAPEAFVARRRARAAALGRLASSDATSPAERILGRVLAERLTSELSLDDAGFTRSLVAPLATPVHQIREVFDVLPHDTPEQWARVAAHLGLVADALDDWAVTLRAAARDGHVASGRQIRTLAAQCERWVAPGGDDVYRRLVAGGPPVAALRTGAAAASEATDRFARFLRDQLLPVARPGAGAGRDLYGATARAFLGDDVDLDETYAFGWDELARLTGELRVTSTELGHDSPEAAASALDADPSDRLTGPALLRWLQERVDGVVDAVDGVHFDLPAALRRVECRLPPAATGVMYYAAPDAAFTRPGRIWWSTPSGGVSHAWREVTTVHHEGVPGHHLQTAIAMSEAGLHPWQRVMAHVHGYVEGWAHYAEALAGELGLLRTPGERLGMLLGQRWRAARIVIDMGLHLGLPIPAGNGFTDETAWSPELAVAVLRAASGLDEAPARFEVERYFGWPAQALAFRVGARLWREVRADAERRPGFDRRAFHMRTLRLGTMGLGPLRQTLGEDGDG
jgi:uncharacterized protein (DUF885 family)